MVSFIKIKCVVFTFTFLWNCLEPLRRLKAAYSLKICFHLYKCGRVAKATYFADGANQYQWLIDSTWITDITSTHNIFLEPSIVTISPHATLQVGWNYHFTDSCMPVCSAEMLQFEKGKGTKRCYLNSRNAALSYIPKSSPAWYSFTAHSTELIFRLYWIANKWREKGLSQENNC